MKPKLAIAAISAALSLFLFSCTLGAALTPPSTPTSTLGPTVTPLPSLTPTQLVDLTPGTPLPTATFDPAAPESWACQIRWQVPANGSKFSPHEHFDVAWQVTNNGYGAWTPETVRLAYFSGRRIQVNDSVPLKGIIEPDRRTQFVVPMVAPRSIGRHTTVWALWYGDRDFCHMSVTIVVK